MYLITEKCIQCGSCAPFCKNGAIDWMDQQYVIDQSRCDQCGVCREYCPIDEAVIEVDAGAHPALNEKPSSSSGPSRAYFYA